jgi:hypothetical protein
MLSTFPFDPCSSEKTLVYRGVPELFGIYELVLLTSPASSSSGARRFPLCAAPATTARRRCRVPSTTSCCISLPRVALALFHFCSPPFLAFPALATRTPSLCGRHRAAAVASSNPSACSYVCKRTSIPRISSTYSNQQLAICSSLAPGTPSPSPPERRRAPAHRRPASLQLLRLQPPHR